MPVTVKQVRDALAEMKDEKLIINNTIISTVRLVGRILDPAMNETRMTFKVDDGTGSIGGGLWILVEEALASELKSIKNGDYATLNGKIVTKSADPLLECYSCRKTTNFNDITLHFLHVISTHLELRKAMPCGGAHKNKMAKEEETPELGDNKKPISTPIDNSTVITDSQTYNPGKTLGTSVSDAIIQIVRELTKSGGMEGVTIKEIGEKLLTKEADLKTILIDLATVGEIYTTVDEEHFKATRTARRDK